MIESLHSTAIAPSSQQNLFLKFHALYAIVTITRKKYWGSVTGTPTGADYDKLCLWFNRVYKQLVDAISQLFDDAQTTTDTHALRHLSLSLSVVLPSPPESDLSPCKYRSWLSSEDLKLLSLTYNQEFWDDKLEALLQKMTSDEDVLAAAE